MTIYKDAGHCIGRIMSIEMHDGTAKAPWQRKYKAGFAELDRDVVDDGMSPEERTTQDAMTRAMLKRLLPEVQWQVLVAKFSINDNEVRDAAAYLTPRVVTPAHFLFRTKCVMAWIVPERRNRLPPAFYEIHTWDVDGTPDRTLRRWRAITKRWLDDQVNAAHLAVEGILTEHGLRLSEAA
ncbi:hypothetical protein [Pseudomonas typographi]|uniref:Phage-like protein n=1 Tax=Pseudomonas typographi TaxID=2715964 RepID=A0ABR7YZE5_9PSED|nr:hypothetical protein [Pseudomonas typographi]MBD1586708.1 hypothetical protein [Pseudomonas typographi]MBD1598601.1 hypothetical protein [Pseudomonas typographi]